MDIAIYLNTTNSLNVKTSETSETRIIITEAHKYM